jgi:hypothetical protein
MGREMAAGDVNLSVPRGEMNATLHVHVSRILHGQLRPEQIIMIKSWTKIEEWFAYGSTMFLILAGFQANPLAGWGFGIASFLCTLEYLRRIRCKA